MKNLIPLTLVATLAASGLSNAQAYSKPSGYVTQALVPNQFNLVGLSLSPAPIGSGTIKTVSGNVLTDSTAAFSVVAGRTYVLEITSGSVAGTIQEVLAANITATTVTTPQNLQTSGLAVGDKYNLRLAPTLEEIFRVDSSSTLARSLNSNTADVVWIPSGTGAYDKYFVHSGTSAFRLAGTTTPAPNIPIVYADGILVQKRGTSSSLVTTGQVKTTGTNSLAVQGFNLVSLVSPVGVTLFNSGLAEDLAVSLSSNTADIVWVPQSNGTYVKYFRHSSGNWRDVNASTVNVTVDVPLPSAVLIQRKSATPASLSLTVPTSYSNL